MEFLYSVRFRRCSTGRPGFGVLAASVSMADSRSSTNAVEIGRLRSRHSGGRHHARPQLERHLLEGLGEVPGALRSTRLQRKIANLISSLWQATQ